MSRGVAFLVCLALAIACATRLSPPEPALAEMDELSDDLAREGLTEMRRYTERLHRVSDPLRLQAAERCDDDVVPYLGAMLEVVGQGRPTPLDRVRRLSGIGVSPTVVQVLPGSPAAEAGLGPNDLIYAFGGRRVIRYEDLLGRLRGAGPEPPRLELERDGVHREVMLPYVAACMLPATFWPYGELSTWRHDGRVVVTRGLMDFVRSDDELAILIAHEMGHEIVGYGRKRFTREIEREADRIGLELAQRAGFEIRGAGALWERLAVERPWMIATAPKLEKREGLAHHGDVAARALLMSGVAASLEARLGASAPGE